MQKPPSKSPSFEGHDRYPTNLAEYNCFTTDGEALSKRLSTSSSELFCSSGDGINVDVFDVDGGIFLSLTLLLFLLLFFFYMASCLFLYGEKDGFLIIDLFN